MIGSSRLLERQTLIAPLGVRFWDVACGGYVSNGLRVIAYPENDRLDSTAALANRSGTYVLHHASGLRDFEMGAGNSPFRDSFSSRRRFTVEVNDDNRCFLPLKFAADLPYEGLFRWRATATREHAPLEPADNSPSVPLFSSTLRTAPAGMAMLRVELCESLSHETADVRTTVPAAWAMLEARFAGRLLGRGIADEKGRLALVFAYPPPRASSSLGTSPATAFTAGLPFVKQEWPIQLQAYYEPTALSPLSPLSPIEPSSSSASVAPVTPYLNDILEQSPVNLFLDEAHTQPLTEMTLRYGPGFFVPAPSAPLSSPLEPKPLSILFISPAG